MRGWITDGDLFIPYDDYFHLELTEEQEEKLADEFGNYSLDGLEGETVVLRFGEGEWKYVKIKDGKIVY